MFLQKKDAFYQNQTHWIDEEPLVHLLPHWNSEGMEGEHIPVWAYNNCEELELFLNGKSLDRKKIERYGHGEWDVEYYPDTIRVDGINGGKVVCSDTRETTGKAVKLNLKQENTVENANGTDIAVISCYCTDNDGREVPTASAYVSFSTNGLGKIAGTGSDIADHNPPHLTSRRMRTGRITVAVEVGTAAGELKVYAEADGLKGGVVTITLESF